MIQYRCDLLSVTSWEEDIDSTKWRYDIAEVFNRESLVDLEELSEEIV